MAEITTNNSGNEYRTSEERDAVNGRLKAEGGEWTSMPPDYTTFSRDLMFRKLDEVHKVVNEETDADKAEIDEAYEQSARFLDKSFDMYLGEKALDLSIARAFVVPMRSDRANESYASESIPFMPLLDPNRFAVGSEIRMRAIYGLPPTVLDTYTKSDRKGEAGALVLAPLYNDMEHDIRQDKYNYEQRTRLLEVGGHVLRHTVDFAHKQLGARVIGLGATLPKITGFGNVLRSMEGMGNLITTTGHGGTVYMIVETARKIMEETSIVSEGKIGVIGGAGSIGWASTIATLEMIKDHKIYSFDTRDTRLHGMVAKSHKENEISVLGSIADVLCDTNIIITAVTGRIDLDDPQFDGIDLTGKVIIDDSQPGCFDMAQVEARGGKLVWVVGEDGSDTGFMTRDGYHTNGIPYNYGDRSGLWGSASEFACGQEAAVIAKYAAYDRAIHDPVTPNNVREVGKYLQRSGARVAPFQAFGQRVHID